MGKVKASCTRKSEAYLRGGIAVESVKDILKTQILPPQDKPPAEDEYIKDGLKYCKNCNTPRQYIFVWDGVPRLHWKNCQCQQDAEDKAEAERKRREWLAKVENLRSAGIPNPSYRAYRFSEDDGKTPDTTTICKNYVANFEKLRTAGQGLLLWGGVGTGKTFMAMCIANALIEKGLPVFSTSLATVVKMAQDFDNADAHFERLMRKALIVLDDLGTERGTSFAQEQIYKFIDGCNTYGVPLIITTNFQPSELKEAAADTADLTYARIYSRILEKCYPVKINAVKRRDQNADRNKAEIAKLLGVKNG